MGGANQSRSLEAGFKLFYQGVDRKRNGIGVILKEAFVRNDPEVKEYQIDTVFQLTLAQTGKQQKFFNLTAENCGACPSSLTSAESNPVRRRSPPLSLLHASPAGWETVHL